MGREVRMVPADWRHPMDEQGRFVPLFDGGGFADIVADWELGKSKWEEGLRDDYKGGWVSRADVRSATYEEWQGECPRREDYMPAWTKEEATHYMMYEDTTEGTPISPAFATPEELARWLADNGASSCGPRTAAYEDWLRVCKGGYAPSMVADERGLRSGVEM